MQHLIDKARLAGRDTTSLERVQKTGTFETPPLKKQVAVAKKVKAASATRHVHFSTRPGQKAA
jgi:hypothetical protein